MSWAVNPMRLEWCELDWGRYNFCILPIYPLCQSAFFPTMLPICQKDPWEPSMVAQPQAQDLSG